MIYVFLANGFEEVEALAPVDILRRAGAEVQTVGVDGDVITGSHKISVKTDIRADQILLDENLEMIVLPGGMPGTVNLGESMEVHTAVNHCAKNDIYIGAICAAPSILGGLGLLEGRNATCFPGFDKELKGAVYTADHVTVDGKYITAKGAGCAVEFGLKLAEVLYGKEKSDELAESLQLL